MNKYFTFWAFALMATFGLAFVSCSDDSKDDGGSGNAYSVKMPSGTTGITIEPLSDAEISKLKSKGYDIVGTPFNVTQNGSDHVVLDDLATVSFKIPKDYPKEDYDELVGVLITDEGPEYFIPDLAGLREGIVRFKTIHFCPTLTTRERIKLEEKFVEYVAIHKWDNDLRVSDFNKLGDKLKDIVDDAGFGENDLLGITMREVLSSNDYVNTTMEYIKHYDNGTLTDKTIGNISEMLTNDIQTKALSILFAKLKKEPNNKAVKECLEKYLTKENMEKAGTLLGSESPADVALEFAKNFAVDKMKSFATQNPYVKAFVVAAEVEVKAIEIFHKFWARNDMIYYYNEYKKDPKNWDDWIAAKIGTPKFEFNMTLKEIGEMFKKRYNDEKKINAKKAEVQDLVDAWNVAGFLNYDNDVMKKYFGENDDYFQRLTRLHGLMERFRKELVIKGELSHYSGLTGGTYDPKSPSLINKELCKIMGMWINMSVSTDPKYNMPEDFYKWLAKEGYIKKKLEKEVDDMEEMRAWWLIETVINRHEDTSRDNGQFVDYMHYTASETEQTMSGMCTGMKSYYEYVQQPVAFFSTIQAPPAYMEAGEKLVLHCTVKRTSPEAYCHIEVSPWMTWESDYSQTWADKVNVVGAKGVGTRDIHAEEGEWDFEVSISGGSKNQKRTLILGDACQSQIRWVYKWCSVFEKD